jgi:hypothetical protein
MCGNQHASELKANCSSEGMLIDDQPLQQEIALGFKIAN